MGVRLEQNIGHSTVIDKRLQRFVIVAALLRTSEKFAVRECSCAALTKGVVRVGVDLAIAVDLRDIAFASRHIASALQYYRLESQLDKSQRRE